MATLYGGAVRTRVRAYASSEGYVDGRALADTWIAEAGRATEAGYLGFKLRIGRDAIAAELDAARQLRAAFPEDALDLMADGNAAYTLGDAVRVGDALHDLGFGWFEEPLPTDGYVDYERLRARLPLPLAGGESLQTPRDARATIDRGAFDLIQPDVSICGGIADTIAIGALARLAGIAIHPHACNGAIGLAASLQVLAAAPRPDPPPGRRAAARGRLRAEPDPHGPAAGAASVRGRLVHDPDGSRPRRRGRRGLRPAVRSGKLTPRRKTGPATIRGD